MDFAEADVTATLLITGHVPSGCHTSSTKAFAQKIRKGSSLLFATD